MSTTSKQFGKAILKKERKKRNIKKKTIYEILSGS